MAHNDPMVAALTRVIVDAARLLHHERPEPARELLEAVANFLVRGENPGPRGVRSADEAA
jgi:hypothetical protein